MTISGLPAGSPFSVARTHAPTLLWILPLSLVLLFAAYQIPGVLRIDVGSGQDADALGGFSWAEGEGANSYRWTAGEARILFFGAGSRAWQLEVRTSGLRPAGLAEVELSERGQAIARQTLSGEMAVYSFTLGRQATNLWGNPEISLSTETFVAPPDQRDLGIMIDWVELSPIGRGPTVPPLGILACMLVVVTISYSSAIVAGRSKRIAQALAIAATLALAVLAARARLWIASNMVWVLLATAFSWLVALRARNARWWEWLLLVALALATVRFTDRAVAFYRDSLPQGDFSIYFDAARNLRTGGPLYDFQAAHEMPNGPVYKYPPLYAAMLAPFTVLDVRSAAEIWYLLNLIMMACSTGMILYGLRRPLRAAPAAAYLIAIAMLIFSPAWESLIRGQMDVVILTACTGAMLLLQARRREGWAGVGIAFATMLKLYPGLLAVYLLLQRRWRALAGFVAASAGFVAISGLVAGWGTLWRYVTEILTVQTAAVPWPENQSWDGFLSRLVIPSDATTWYTTIPFPQWTLLALYALDAVCLGTTIWLLWRHRRDDVGWFQLGFVTAMPLIVMMWPTAWIHYQTLLLLPLGWLVWQQMDGGFRSWSIVALLVAAFGLIALGNEYTVLKPALAESWPRLLQSYKLYGVLILWFLLLRSGVAITGEDSR